MYVKATEGTTNDQVQDPHFHRSVQPPSVDQQLNRAGTPPITSVPSLKNPRISMNPHPRSPGAASDLAQQSTVSVSLSPEALQTRKNIARQHGASQSRQRKILELASKAYGRKTPLPANYVRVDDSGLGRQYGARRPSPVVIPIPAVAAQKRHGMGDSIVSLPITDPWAVKNLAPIPGSSVWLVNAESSGQPVLMVSAAPKVATAVPVTTPAPAGTAAPLPSPSPQQPGFMDQVNAWLNQQMISGIPNSYLVGGTAGIVLLAALAARKKRR